MRIVPGVALLLGIGISGPAIGAEVPNALEPLEFLLGEWVAAGGGAPGAATGSATFARGLQDRVIVRTSYADYPATATKPAFRHDDLMIIHAAAGGGILADYYDSEGHVIRYVVSVPAPGEALFLSEASSDAPRFRLTYQRAPDGVLKGKFEIAPPGKPEGFSPYLSWESRRSGSTGQKSRP